MQEIKKNIKIEYGRNRYQNISDENKQRLKKTKEIILNKKNNIIFFSLHGIKMHFVKIKDQLVLMKWILKE